MSRPRLTTIVVENNYDVIKEHLNKNELIACQMDEGVTVLLN